MFPEVVRKGREAARAVLEQYEDSQKPDYTVHEVLDGYVTIEVLEWCSRNEFNLAEVDKDGKRIAFYTLHQRAVAPERTSLEMAQAIEWLYAELERLMEPS